MRRKNAKVVTVRRVVGYVRVSTEDQARDGASLDAQEARIRAYGTASGHEIEAVIVDAGESAKTLSRPGMAQVIEGVKAGAITTVVVLKLDRLTRSIADLCSLLELFDRHSTALISLSESLDTSTAAGRLMVNVLGSVSQFEREAIAERTKVALDYKRARREAYAPTPFGYRRDGEQLIPEPFEQAALVEMRQMDRAGKSYRAIARMLELRGVRPHRGRRWYASSVRAVLRSRMSSAA